MNTLQIAEMAYTLNPCKKNERRVMRLLKGPYHDAYKLEALSYMFYFNVTKTNRDRLIRQIKKTYGVGSELAKNLEVDIRMDYEKCKTYPRNDYSGIVNDPKYQSQIEKALSGMTNNEAETHKLISYVKTSSK